MKNQVTTLLNKEAALEAQLKQVAVEKEQLAINVLADADVLVKELGCAHLLNTSTESIVNIAINKGKVVKVVKEVEVKVEDTTRINKLTAEIEEYKKAIKDYEFEKEMTEAQTNSIINRFVDEAVKAAKEENAALKKKVKALETIVNTPDIDEANDKDILVQAIKSKDAYIVELETKLQDKAYNAAEDGYIVDGVEVSLEVVKSLQEEIAKSQEINAELAEQVARFKKSSSSFQSRATKAENEVAKLNTVIAELQAQLAEATKPMTTTNEVVEETGLNDDYLLYLATQEESIMAQFNEEQEEVVENTIETKKEVKEEIKKKETNKANGPEYVKLVSAKLGKSEHVKLFLTESCYLIASPFAQEMTWITNGPISDEYKMQVEEILVKDYKFNKSRVEVSPIVVSDSVGYMARVKGAEGTNVYSNDDVYSGYVKYKGDFILYTYFPNTNTAIIESLDKKILESQGKLSGSTMPKDKKALQFVNGKIRNMFKKYEALTADIRKEHAESVKKANDNFNAKAEEANRILEARRAKILAAAANDPTIAAELNRMEGGTNREEVTTVVDDNEPLLDSSIDTNEFDSVLNEFGGF